MSVSRDKISYGGWKDCLRLANGSVEAVLTTAVGPRVIRYGLDGGENVLGEVEADRGLTGGEEWRLYGGHRLWHSPEDPVRTYQPDNRPLAVREIPGGAALRQPVEEKTGIEKELEVTLAPAGSRVFLRHRLTNRGLRPVELAAWAITVMAPGGREVVPQPEPAAGLLPDRLLALWPYSRLDDPRLVFSGRYILLRQDPEAEGPLKLGLPNREGWAGYFNRGRFFRKSHCHQPGSRYPDFGCSYETYTNAAMLEMESLSPLAVLEPGGSIEHREEWELFDNVPDPGPDSRAVEAALASLHLPEMKGEV
ncbi:MAG: hypothetical protein P9M08_07410 [Candidatus Erginobacter occultus]|nr:hypothetical protein [Candidatus Erginobacter occultus]